MTVITHKIFKNILLVPVAFVFTVLNITFLAVIFPTLSVVFLVYKCIIIVIANCKMPGATILALQDTMMAKENIHTEVDLYQSGQWHFEGNLNLEEFMKLFDERVLKKTLPNGKLKFPEIQCSIEPFMGYFFHKKDKAFDLRNHIREYQPDFPNEIINRKKLDKIVHEFTYTLYPVNKSPWGILIVNNCRLDEEDGKEYSVLIGKNHHCIGDAYAVLILFWEALFLQDIKQFRREKVGETIAKPKIMQTLQTVAAVCGAARDFTKTAIKFSFDFVFNRPRLYDENSWHSKKTYSEHVHTTLPPIPTSLVKEICVKCKVSISTVLIAIAIGGFRRMMEENGHKTPNNCRMCYSLPLPNHPDRMTTHSSVTFVDLNLNCSVERERLLMDEKNLKMAARFSLLFGLPFMSFFLSPFPVSWKWYFPAESYALSFSSFMANAPVPTPASGDVHFMGCRLAKAYGTCEQSAKKINTPTVIGVMKYKDGFFTNFAIQRHLLTNEDQIYEIERFILEELHHLRKCILEPGDDLSNLDSAGDCEDDYDMVTHL